MRRRSALRALLASAMSLALGCQLLVTADVPEFACTGADPSACPSGTTCDETVGRCVTPDASADAEEDASDAGADVKPDNGPTLAGLGEPCRIDAECSSRLCGSSTILTSVITATQGPICTRTCCTSADCPSTFVCFSGGTGGNYCVPAAKAERSPPPSGGKGPGAACSASANDECRSGLCENGRCLDTCCLPGDCAAGTLCRVRSVGVPAPSHDIWVCAPQEADAGKNPGEPCQATSDCRNDNCVGVGVTRTCRPPCCSKATCTAQGFPNGHCAYGPSGSDQLKFCFFSTDPNDTPIGGTCTADGDCQTDYCDPETKRCAEICCQDSDCPAGLSCRPSATNTPFLRCVK